MPILSICPTSFAPDAPLLFSKTDLDKGADVDTRSRRVTRVKTLDADVVLYDAGYTVGDSDVSIVARLKSLDDYDVASGWLELFPAVSVSTRSGIYEGRLERVSLRAEKLYLDILLKGRLDG